MKIKEGDSVLLRAVVTHTNDSENTITICIDGLTPTTLSADSPAVESVVHAEQEKTGKRVANLGEMFAEHNRVRRGEREPGGD